jgi:hypothetical protein
MIKKVIGRLAPGVSVVFAAFFMVGVLSAIC